MLVAQNQCDCCGEYEKKHELSPKTPPRTLRLCVHFQKFMLRFFTFTSYCFFFSRAAFLLVAAFLLAY